METTMMRVRTSLLGLLRELAQDEGVSMQVVLARALDDYKRKRFLERGNEGYRALRADPVAWEEELRERAAWNATLADGLEADEFHGPPTC